MWWGLRWGQNQALRPGTTERIKVVRLAMQSNLELLELGDMGPYYKDALGQRYARWEKLEEMGDFGKMVILHKNDDDLTKIFGDIYY